MRALRFFSLLILFILTVSVGMARAETSVAEAPIFDSTAPYMYMVDVSTNTVLFQKSADTSFHPASMTKAMTAYLTFERLKDGRLKMDDTLAISENAWRKQGSKTFVGLGSNVAVKDLIYGMIVQSGNDATTALAEGIAGSEEAFVDLMNAKAKELGMTKTHFRNPYGWPDENHFTSAHDLGILAADLIRRFPEYYPIYSTREFTYNGIRQFNRNPLLGAVPYADGMKTGFTDMSGYCLIGSGIKNGRRIVFVVGGMKTAKDRAVETRRFLDWGFREFSRLRFAKGGESVATTAVWQGQKDTVNLTVAEDLVATFPAAARDGVKRTLSFPSVLSAPLKKGDIVGKATYLSTYYNINVTRDIVVAEDVPSIGFFDGLSQRISYFFGGQ
jgi:D-alanyl-D-alanine carboxypeptidase (penicillin-binding protein 5/6)